MQNPGTARADSARTVFVVLFVVVTAAKIAIASRLPLFVDEAFYWLEGQHLAAAYSDLPGLTAWLARLGVALGGNHALALRAPFLVLGACVPWLAMRIAAREYGPRAGWIAASLALLLPLAGTLGVLALPDVALAVATLLCLDAGAGLMRGVRRESLVLLALGLALGALSHYRFAAVIAAGGGALLLLGEGRQALRDARTWLAIGVGSAAWLPLVIWNITNADAGLRFQLVDRHPWSFHLDGAWFVAIQCALVTPLLFAALASAAWRGARLESAASRWFAVFGGGVVLAFFLLGFFADNERVSFHWPLPGYLALLLLVPDILARWSRPLRTATWVTAGAGLAAICGYLVAVSSPFVRAETAAGKWYPANFSGWDPLARVVEESLAGMPADTRLAADNFKVGAELGFALGRPDIAILDHPLNHKHGRAPQLGLWGTDLSARELADGRSVLLVVGITQVKFSELVERYQALCAQFGMLPAPRFVNVDHGQQRFALFAFRHSKAPKQVACATPAIANIDFPGPQARVPAKFEVKGWAVQDGVGVANVTLTLDGVPVAVASVDVPNDWVARFWKGRSNDPQHPHVAFRASVDASFLPTGRHWLGMTLRGNDGSVQEWAEHPIDIVSD